MKKSLKKLSLIAVMVMLTICCSTTAQAKTKKLKVNTIYTTTKKIKGTTKLKKAKVVAKIGKKTYKAKSNSKGKFTIKIKKKRAKGTKIKIRVYKKKKVYAKKTLKVKEKPWYQKKPYKGHKAALAGGSGISYQKVPNQYDNQFIVYCKKGYYVRFTIAGEIKCISTKVYKKTALSNVYTKKTIGTKKVTLKIYRNKDDKLVDSYSITPKKIKLPGKTEEIDYEQFMKDYNQVKSTGKTIEKSIGKSGYLYQIFSGEKKDGGVDYVSIGYVSRYIESVADGSHVKITAKNGATLYYTIGANGSFGFAPPTLAKYDGIIKSGETKKYEGTDFKEGELQGDSLYTKIYAYKNGRLVAISQGTDYLIQGYADWMFK